MTRRPVIAVTGLLLAALAATTAVVAQGNAALAGSWSLDESARGGRGGIRGIPIATELVVTLSPAQVVVESNTGSARAFQTFLFKLDGTETEVPGPLGWANTATARWDGDRLVVTSRRTLEGGPNGPMSVEVTDVYVVAGDVLTIERTQGRRTDELVYRRTS